jgi:hypothetical protein
MLNRQGAILTLFIVGSLLSGCSGTAQNTNAPAANAATNSAQDPKLARTNAEELSVLINLPFETEDVAWKSYTERNKLIAVFRFSPADAARVVAEVSKSGPPRPVNIAVETWFPDELIAQSDMSGDKNIRGLAYPATIFYQEPYKNGSIAHIEGGDYFVLELSSK